LRVTHCVENLNRGGLERAVIDLIRAQVAAGHECQVICLFQRGLLADELADLGVAVHACGKRRGFDLRALAHLRHHLKAHATEVLHTHNATAHYHAVWAAFGLGIRRVINTRHGMGALESGSRRERLYRRALRGTHAVVTVCEAARRELLRGARLPAHTLVAVANGIRVERFRPADAGTRAHLVSQLGLAPGTCVIGTVGRLVRAKHHVALIEAFAAVHARSGNCALILVGDGELRGELEAQVDSLALRGHVHLLGDRSDVADLLAGFDIFALSSLTEGYSIALLEACAAGLPIVATDVGGNAEIVRDGSNGRLVAAGSISALAAALQELVDVPARREAMARHSRAWVLEHGSYTAMAARYDALYG
jgi:glycosyltransferase involved in cell wall biosynthesis